MSTGYGSWAIIMILSVTVAYQAPTPPLEVPYFDWGENILVTSIATEYKNKNRYNIFREAIFIQGSLTNTYFSDLGDFSLYVDVYKMHNYLTDQGYSGLSYKHLCN